MPLILTVNINDSNMGFIVSDESFYVYYEEQRP